MTCIINILDPYTFQDIISWCDVDSKYVMRVVCKKLNGIKITEKTFPEYASKIHYYAINGMMRLTKYELSKNKAEIGNGLDGASRGGHLELVKYLVDKCKQEEINSGLLCACIGGNVEIVKLLMAKGGEYNLHVLFGIARKLKHIEIMKLLTDNGFKCKCHN
jgi:hypothetical protein